MRLRPLRLVAAATLVAAAGLLVPSTVTAPPAAATTACATVTVVVDFASLGGGSATRCSIRDPSSGIEALEKAGFSVTPVYNEAFVCRIDGKPASDPCRQTPPSNAYWSYWHAKPGGSWVWSSKGAGTYDPAPGSVEGWAFGAGKPPSTPPPAPRPAPTTAAPHPSATSGGTSGGGTSSGSTGAHSTAPRPGAHPSASVLGTKTASTAAATPTATDATTPPSGATSTDAAPGSGRADPPAGDHRLPAPLLGLGGLMLVGGLGGAAWWRARHGAGEP